MRRPRLFWRIYATYLLIVVLCTAAVGFYAVGSTRSFYMEHTEAELQSRARLVRQQLAPLIASDTPAQLETLVRGLGRASGTRITLISAGRPGTEQGAVLADSDAVPGEMENHGDRPEFLTALQGRAGKAIRPSATLQGRHDVRRDPGERGRPHHLGGARRHPADDRQSRTRQPSTCASGSAPSSSRSSRP